MSTQTMIGVLIGIPFTFIMVYILSRLIFAAYFRSKRQAEISTIFKTLKKEG